MESFAPILGMTMMVVGLIGFMVFTCLTFYFIEQEDKEPPVEQPAPLAASGGGTARGSPVAQWRRRRAYLRVKRRRRV